jgi:hypothetical protein
MTEPRLEFSGSPVELRVGPIWDGISLALAGIIYDIFVTVAGVVVAVCWPHWWSVLIYAVVVLGLLAWGLLRPRLVIVAMRRLANRQRTVG